MLILHHEGYLRLRRQADVFTEDFVAGCHDRFFIQFDILIGFLLGSVDQVIGCGAVLTPVAAEHFRTVVFTLAVAFVYGQFVVQIPFGVGGEVALVRKGIVADLLDLRILCGIDLEAAAVEQCVGLGLIIACSDQIFQYIVRQCIHEICIDGGIFVLGICDLNTGVDIICHGLIVFLLGDVALIEHIIQHFLAALHILFGMGDGIIAGRILCDGRYDCTFRQV